MSTEATTETLTAAPIRRRVLTKRPAIDLSEMKTFLATLGMASDPTVHVNGAAYAHCVMTVDFGQPLVRSPKLTTEQSIDLIARLRKITRDLVGREVNVRVSNDGQTGIYWTSIT